MQHLFLLENILIVMVVQSSVSANTTWKPRSAQLNNTINYSEPIRLLRNNDSRELIEFPNFETNFEDETYLSWWIDKSPSAVKWKIENCTLPWEPNNQVLCQGKGKRHLRVDRGLSRSFGVAVLSSPDFILTQTETLSITFSFWIRSKWSQFNNLQFYVVENGVETLMTSLSSSSSKLDWQTDKVFTGQNIKNRTVSFVFYAFCGTNIEDSIAIDDVYVNLLTTTTENTTSFTTTTVSSTTESKTTEYTTQDSTTQESSTKESTTTESKTTEYTTQDSTTQESSTKESTTTESSTFDFTTQDSTTQESSTNESTTTESKTTEYTTQDSTTQESVTKESTTTEAFIFDFTTQDSTTQESPTKESTTTESFIFDFTTQDSTTQEHATTEPTIEAAMTDTTTTYSTTI